METHRGRQVAHGLLLVCEPGHALRSSLSQWVPGESYPRVTPSRSLAHACHPRASLPAASAEPALSRRAGPAASAPTPGHAAEGIRSCSPGIVHLSLRHCQQRHRMRVRGHADRKPGKTRRPGGGRCRLLSSGGSPNPGAFPVPPTGDSPSPSRGSCWAAVWSGPNGRQDDYTGDAGHVKGDKIELCHPPSPLFLGFW